MLQSFGNRKYLINISFINTTSSSIKFLQYFKQKINHEQLSDKNKVIYCRNDAALICLPADGEGEEPNNNLMYFILKHTLNYGKGVLCSIHLITFTKNCTQSCLDSSHFSIYIDYEQLSQLALLHTQNGRNFLKGPFLHTWPESQWWANFDRTPLDLYTTLFRDLSATPFTQIKSVLSKWLHFFFGTAGNVDVKVSIMC